MVIRSAKGTPSSPKCLHALKHPLSFLCVVIACSRVSHIIRKRSTFHKRTPLHRKRKEAIRIDLFPKIKSSLRPIVRNIFQIALDDRVHVAWNVQHLFDDIRIETFCSCVFHQCRRAKCRSVPLRPAPRSGEKVAVDFEFGLASVAYEHQGPWSGPKRGG